MHLNFRGADMWRQKADLRMTEYSKLEGRRTPWPINTKSNSLERPKDTALTSKWKKERENKNANYEQCKANTSIHTPEAKIYKRILCKTMVKEN